MKGGYEIFKNLKGNYLCPIHMKVICKLPQTRHKESMTMKYFHVFQNVSFKRFCHPN